MRGLAQAEPTSAGPVGQCCAVIWKTQAVTARNNTDPDHLIITKMTHHRRMQCTKQAVPGSQFCRQHKDQRRG